MKQITIFGLLSFGLFFHLHTFSQESKTITPIAEEEIDTLAWEKKIQWVDLQTALDEQKEHPKKIFMFLHTPWCNFCREVKQSLLIDDDFAKTINEEFIPVKFNAESTDTIRFLDHEFVNQEESGYHELPIIFSQGKMSFPTMFFFNEDMKLVSTVKGNQENIPEFTDYVHYIGSDAYKTTPWVEYEAKQTEANDEE